MGPLVRVVHWLPYMYNWGAADCTCSERAGVFTGIVEADP